MSTPVTVTELQVKSHGAPDEVRTPDKTRVEVVKLDGYTIGRFNFAPGWRWSDCIKPVVKTEQCQLSHLAPSRPSTPGSPTPFHRGTMPGSRAISRSLASRC